MSNRVIYDSVLVHYLARELRERLSGDRIRSVRFDPDPRRLSLELDQQRLVWELHPERGWIRWLPRELPQEAAEGWGGRAIATQRRARIRDIRAPADERWLILDIDAGGPDRASRFVIELMTNQWNALALAPDGKIVSALWKRSMKDRQLRAGEVYASPQGTAPGETVAPSREGADQPVSLERWRVLLGDVAPEDRRGILVRSLAWTSTINAPAILGDAASADSDGDTLPASWERYRAIAERPDPRPRILNLRGGIPYPLPLPGVESSPATSLLAAMETAQAATASATLAPEVRQALESRLERVRRRAEQLHAEAEQAPARAAALRQKADLLMAQLHQVPRGAEEAELDDYQGGRIVVSLDPSVSAAENAEALYDRARKRDRAAQRLPDRVREVVAEQNRLEALLESLEVGGADPAEVERWLREVRPEQGGSADEEERLPYRRYTSSGGLEIRVGRSGRSNDDLTFHHSAPDDIWLHARDVAGAHVILRWGERDGNPPQRDLMEAAVLAALGSKARTSGAVPVDWTRRKYVRKPRKAPPGAVLPDRVSTLFVQPDPTLPERLSRE